MVKGSDAVGRATSKAGQCHRGRQMLQCPRLILHVLSVCQDTHLCLKDHLCTIEPGCHVVVAGNVEVHVHAPMAVHDEGPYCICVDTDSATKTDLRMV